MALFPVPADQSGQARLTTSILVAGNAISVVLRYGNKPGPAQAQLYATSSKRRPPRIEAVNYSERSSCSVVGGMVVDAGQRQLRELRKDSQGEEIYADQDRDRNHLRENIAAFIDTYYLLQPRAAAFSTRLPATEEFE